MSDQAALKRAAAEAAVDAEVRSGMCLGLGSGSTATLMLDALADRLRHGRLADVSGVPTSEATAARCRELGISLHTLDERSRLDVAIDGADEVDPELRLIKGLGGAHLREKVVAAAADRFAVVADESKLVARLGERAPLPVEVVRFAEPVSARLLRDLGWEPEQRQRDGDPWITDEGNHILDCRRADWSDPERLEAEVAAVPGVVGHGMFLGFASVAYVATSDGVRVLTA